MESNFKDRDIISITDFNREEILFLCQKAMRMRDLEKGGQRAALADELKYKALAYMFYEPSTRTKASFITAMRQLGGHCDGFSGIEGTSVMKKETIRDTVMMMEANHFDVIVMRHPLDGSLQWAADVASIPVINGGDGKNEHPTQSLLDAFSLFCLNEGKLDGINIGFGGDLSHGRTIRSLSLALSHFKDITIRWAAEDFLGMPEDLITLLESRGVKVIRDENVEDLMSKVRFYYMTRPQLERMEKITPKDIMETMQKYSIDLGKVKNRDVKLMHPLPVNSEIAEIHYEVYFDEAQAFFQQAENGVFLRKALIHEMLKDKDSVPFKGKLNPVLKEGNNRLQRTAQNDVKKERQFIDNIAEGIVIDHLQAGTEQNIAAELDLVTKGYSSISAHLPKAGKSFLKSDLSQLKERELKRIALLSPEATINFIKGGKVVDKFVYLLCRNRNCVTRYINEDVPPKFYMEQGTIRCRYCRKSYVIQSKKIDSVEIEKFRNSLSAGIEKI
ncbi:MAG: aspartate carbamoyltransferase [Candidatus Aminicenantes bacterium]|nr:aspartate carbamoyltransferase [Candidatus Aminicenantes bacterium]